MTIKECSMCNASFEKVELADYIKEGERVLALCGFCMIINNIEYQLDLLKILVKHRAKKI